MRENILVGYLLTINPHCDDRIQRKGDKWNYFLCNTAFQTLY